MNAGRQSAALPARLISAIRARSATTLLADAVNEWHVHNAPRLGAALVFYALVSLTPLLIVLVALSGSIFTQRVAGEEIIQQVRSITGSNAAAALIRAVLEGSGNANHGFMAKAVAVQPAFGASAVLLELRDTLNTMWDVPANRAHRPAEYTSNPPRTVLLVCQGTPEGWATYEGKTEIADYLRARAGGIGKTQ